MKPEPIDTELYSEVLSEAKNKFKAFPSAYASAWIVRTYKNRGGRYKGRKSKYGLDKWFKENWVDVCYWPKRVACGRKSADSPEAYPYCRPTIKVNASTPQTVYELSQGQIKKRCQRKRESPDTKVNVK